MKKFAFLFSLALFAVGSTSCKKIKGSNTITTEVRAVSNFTQIDVEDAFEVDVTYSATQELVEVEAPENLHEYIVTDVVSGRMKVHFKHNKNISCKTAINLSSILKLVQIALEKVRFEHGKRSNYLRCCLRGAGYFKFSM